MYFYETPVPLSRSIREFSRRLGKKMKDIWKKLKDLDKKLKEFCPKLSNLATLSWWWLLNIGQKSYITLLCYEQYLQKSVSNYATSFFMKKATKIDGTTNLARLPLVPHFTVVVIFSSTASTNGHEFLSPGWSIPLR